MTQSLSKLAARLDRPSETAAANKLKDAPWETDRQRGALNLERDGSQHRKYHSLFEDMLN
ncbi:hypothetical protein [Cognatishimia sp. MH4019]|uniref:hypothetical protein n=1 Tax=Cognatishimia sp. MH4019 TaxID=2854030 RepID=UPI001CD60F85|nr:hypothetical protein [Cognatishimia sp. MH4019]